MSMFQQGTASVGCKAHVVRSRIPRRGSLVLERQMGILGKRTVNRVRVERLAVRQAPRHHGWRKSHEEVEQVMIEVPRVDRRHFTQQGIRGRASSSARDSRSERLDRIRSADVRGEFAREALLRHVRSHRRVGGRTKDAAQERFGPRAERRDQSGGELARPPILEQLERFKAVIAVGSGHAPPSPS